MHRWIVNDTPSGHPIRSYIHTYIHAYSAYIRHPQAAHSSMLQMVIILCHRVAPLLRCLLSTAASVIESINIFTPTIKQRFSIVKYVLTHTYIQMHNIYGDWAHPCYSMLLSLQAKCRKMAKTKITKTHKSVTVFVPHMCVSVWALKNRYSSYKLHSSSQCQRWSSSCIHSCVCVCVYVSKQDCPSLLPPHRRSAFPATSTTPQILARPTFSQQEIAAGVSMAFIVVDILLSRLSSRCIASLRKYLSGGIPNIASPGSANTHSSRGSTWLDSTQPSKPTDEALNSCRQGFICWCRGANVCICMYVCACVLCLWASTTLQLSINKHCKWQWECWQPRLLLWMLRSVCLERMRGVLREISIFVIAEFFKVCFHAIYLFFSASI